MFSATFWQHLLASEASPFKAGLVLQELAETRMDPLQALRISAHLTQGERERMNRNDPAALERALKAGARVIEASDFSPTLKQAAQVPPAVFVRGNWSVFNAPTVAIVGTRNASTYGKAVAQKFAERLAQAGVTVVSGGAVGVDASAHEGALQAGGRTVAVIATGVDVYYPSNHRNLHDRIAQSGAIVSQFACGTKPDAYRFLFRNQLMAAMSDAVLVVEAPEKSGALRTAGSAADLGRDVFVVPGSISTGNFKGSHGLIRDGAMLVDHPDQILESLGIEPPVEQASSSADLSEVQQRIMEVLGDEPISTEVIAQKTRLEMGEILSELTFLEVDGLVMRDGVGFARRP